ncbi:hypothetical protein TOK_5857 [Pseudonocardia sp. N23]|nr:hypothetical protein TOK_5857 [Pseudonocardia sp. N23]
MASRRPPRCAALESPAGPRWTAPARSPAADLGPPRMISSPENGHKKRGMVPDRSPKPFP